MPITHTKEQLPNRTEAHQVTEETTSLTQPKSSLNPLTRAIHSVQALSQFISAETEVKIAQALAWGHAYETQAFAEGVSNVPAHEVHLVGEGRRNPEVLPASIHNMFSSTEDVVSRVMDQVKIVLESDSAVLQENRAHLEDQCLEIVERCILTQNMVCSARVAHLSPLAAHDALFDSTQCLTMLSGATGSAPVATNLSTTHWGEWFPGLSIDHMTVREVRNKLPGISEAALPRILFKIEDPRSPDKLLCAIKLADHDILHIILGMGLVDQSEAFVVGATMGSARKKLSDQDVVKMCQVFSRAYPEPYSVKGAQLHAFLIAVDAFRNTGIPELYNQDLTRRVDCTVGELRSRLGISRDKLRRIHAAVVAKNPNSYDSVRLGLMLPPV
jgi:hypothetical protein